MPTKILMVCLGNICRSPLAEGILAAKLPKDKFIVDSAGTGNWHVGSAPDKRSIAAAKKFGLDISKQKCRQISTKDFEDFDHIFVMDNSNYSDVIALTENPNHQKKVTRLLDVLFPNENVEVPDPYFGHEQGFEDCYKLIDEACFELANELQKDK